MANNIHPSVHVDGTIKVGEDVTVMQGAVLGEKIVLGSRVKIYPGVVIDSHVKIGDDCQIYPGSMIMNNSELGRGVVMLPHTVVAYETTIGDGTILYSGAQVGQKCKVGKKVELMATTVAGNVTIDDAAVISNGGVHQFCHIGKLAFIGGGTMIRKDVPPYVAVADFKGIVQPTFLNEVGANRQKMTPEQKKNVKDAYRILYSSGKNVAEAMEDLKKLAVGQESVELEEIIRFIENSERGIYTRKKSTFGNGHGVLKWINPARLYRSSDRYESLRAN
jgi:UDP-N-acetylglucosamine acyltransferase